ncbi:MAG: hypothetical protein Ta2D_05530 [Rickettsiales bacterium]|nr:MAG: hypothetical protein Ta2D_05530 [Rickettsiales bacterium]
MKIQSNEKISPKKVGNKRTISLKTIPLKAPELPKVIPADAEISANSTIVATPKKTNVPKKKYNPSKINSKR